MILPDGKKYILYIKTSKTGGTSFLNLLNKIKKVKLFVRKGKERILQDLEVNDIIMIQNDILEIFKKKTSRYI